MSRIVSIVCVVAGVFAGLLLNNNLDVYVNKLREWYFDIFISFKHQNLFTSVELAEYNGEIRPELYMAFMGIVYDVSKAKKHYGKGSPYHYFVGKDGTRAFVTGDFKDQTENKDHIIDLTCNELLALVNWRNTIHDKYKLAGFLLGRYYDRYARETLYQKQCAQKVGRCLTEKELAKEENRKYPPCNIAWSAEEGTRVWCTKSSGGITRGWTGVPRQLYSPGSKKPHCVCVNDATAPLMGMIKEYDNCSNSSTSCNIQDD